MKKQTVVRSYPHECTAPTSQLTSALEKGYTVVSCQPFYRKDQGNEYILEKDDDTPNDDDGLIVLNQHLEKTLCQYKSALFTAIKHIDDNDCPPDWRTNCLLENEDDSYDGNTICKQCWMNFCLKSHLENN